MDIKIQKLVALALEICDKLHIHYWDLHLLILIKKKKRPTPSVFYSSTNVSSTHYWVASPSQLQLHNTPGILSSKPSNASYAERCC